MRRIITGHNEDGKSVVMYEGCLLYTSPSPRDY